MMDHSLPEPPAAPPRLWIDVEDLFEYARGNPRPSGIQRLAFEMYSHLYQRDAGAGLVRFVRHDPARLDGARQDPARSGLRAVPWEDVAALFATLTGPAEPPAPAHLMAAEEPPPRPPGRRLTRRALERLPLSLQAPAADMLRSQLQALLAFRALARALAGALVRSLRGSRPPGVPVLGVAPPSAPEPLPPPAQPPGALMSPGDVLVVLGSPWSHADYAGLVRGLQERHGIRFALLVYDLIPLRRPEWCDRGLVRQFREWFDSVFPLCDAVFAISQASAADVELYARQRGIVLPGRVVALPIGTGFGPLADAPAARSRRLPPPGSYALIVSTIEARKNHLLLFRVWRRMLEELPADQVPTLVFAGRVGWLVDDLMRQIANTDNLGGKLLLVENPSDAEQAALYQGCLFTLFPSFYEGWGLPVTESLAFGKPCLISDRTSLPEAGHGLARSFDPDNLHDAYAAIRRVLDDRADLAAWEATVRREFRPVPWSATVEALLAGLGHPLAAVRAGR